MRNIGSQHRSPFSYQLVTGPLLDRLIELRANPWDAVPERPGQSMVRHAFFGADDQGMLTFNIHEQTETLRIIDII
ncbi:hypothetical protein GCM10023196_007180 [Actinoallomurus vinaceus]|uniref:Uncharacterized protein n=1 Tax=Actinoallomurus vinaceus TaxID=1080074 RepID=A0ABP8U2J3_9ACTN